MRKRQRGLTMWGVLFYAFLFGFVAYTVSRLLPAYMDYWAIKRGVAQLAADSTPTTREAEVRDRFHKEMRLNNITVVNGHDLVLEKAGDGLHITVEWTDRRPFVGDVSLCLEFKVEGMPPNMR